MLNISILCVFQQTLSKQFCKNSFVSGFFMKVNILLRLF